MLALGGKGFVALPGEQGVKVVLACPRDIRVPSMAFWSHLCWRWLCVLLSCIVRIDYSRTDVEPQKRSMYHRRNLMYAAENLCGRSCCRPTALG